MKDIFEVGQAGSEDSLEVTAYGDGFTISVDNPWAGDTESGFGASCSVRLNTENARELAEWLLVQCTLKQPPATEQGPERPIQHHDDN